jgi:2-C-methyl-D-erythritol 4-phosphate cytidylyltransferase
MQLVSSTAPFVCIHDAARPFISYELVKNVMEEAWMHGAASAAVPIKFTIKEAGRDNFVTHTPERSRIWEVQTPQVIKQEWLQEGFKIAKENNITVTDDVSLVELLSYPVKLVEGTHSNLKITTPEDMLLAEQLYKTRHEFT